MPEPGTASSNTKYVVSSAAQRLRKNINRYLGETIDIAAVLRDCVVAAQTHAWHIEEIPVAPKRNLLAFCKSHSVSHPNHPLHIYISAGIHGDEPAGPLAVRELLQANHWPANTSIWICPCLNPSGFELNQRENAEGLDLNRQYLDASARETKAHMEWLGRQPSFDLSLCLHEDWESEGFYLYELNPDVRPSLAGAILSTVAEVCPIDESELIEGRVSEGGLIRPSVDPASRPQWPEAFFLLNYKTRLCYTLEAPSDFPLPIRVAALVQGVKAAIEALRRQASY